MGDAYAANGSVSRSYLMTSGTKGERESRLSVDGNDRHLWPDDSVEVLRRLYPALLGTAYRLTPSPQEAEDLVQDALVRTLAQHPNLGTLAHPLGYTRTVLWRLAFARRRFRTIDVSEHLSSLVEQADARPPAEDLASLGEGLNQLGPRQRACIGLRFLYGFDDQAIADVLGCSLSTVRSQTTRGLARLREHMEARTDAE